MKNSKQDQRVQFIVLSRDMKHEKVSRPVEEPATIERRPVFAPVRQTAFSDFWRGLISRWTEQVLLQYDLLVIAGL